MKDQKITDHSINKFIGSPRLIIADSLSNLDISHLISNTEISNNNHNYNQNDLNHQIKKLNKFEEYNKKLKLPVKIKTRNIFREV